jgi:uncharacterized protein YprB with RNaseH-like and TPR domain
MRSSDDHSRPSTPPELCQVTEEVAYKLLPQKSTKCYAKSYENFISWKKAKNAESFSQRELLAYFNELSQKYKPATLWSEYSRLKTMIYHNLKIDINSYTDLEILLKNVAKQSDKETKKAKIFSSREIEQFLNEAPDNQWLAIKV